MANRAFEHHRDSETINRQDAEKAKLFIIRHLGLADWELEGKE